MKKTLLVYYSLTNATRNLCETSAQPGEVDVMELRERYDRGLFSAATAGAYQAVIGQGSHIDPIEVDLDAYDTIIIASPVWAGNPVPAVNAFLHQCNLRGREVCGLLLHEGKLASHAADILRKRISLAGGSCRAVVSVPTRELRARQCDLFSYARERSPLSIVLT